MRIGKSLLFILAVFALLGTVSATIPEGGLTMGVMTLKFPTIEEIFNPDEDSDKAMNEVQAQLDGEAIKLFIENIQLSEQMQMRNRATKNRISIDFPNDSVEWIFGLFEQLERAKREKIRILHYGDSQIEEDRISSVLRELLQQRFGGYGVGWVPTIQSVATSAIGQSQEVGGTRWLIYGTPEMRHPERLYGAMGQSVSLNGNATISLYPVKMKYREHGTEHFGRITVMIDRVVGEMSLSVSYGDKVIERRATEGDKFVEFVLPDSTSRATISLSGEAMVYGLLVDGSSTGVQLDNAAMRGCSGTIFRAMASESMRPYFERYNVPLIIMQYGGNTVPYIKGEKALNNYCKSLAQQFEYLKRVSPKSKILFVGPSDMSTKIDDKMVTYPYLPTIVDSLRSVCNDNDVAYWDLYRAMGGKNSMATWVNSTPQLAGADYIHFTRTGANRTSEMIFEAIELAYDYYRYLEGDEIDIYK